MTTEEKIQAIETSGLPIAFDGCHKIYFLTDEVRKKDAASYGYEPFHESSALRDLIAQSCGLVFVSKWGLDNDDFEHPWTIRQGELNLEEDEDD
jgi:hypothetical protein